MATQNANQNLTGRCANSFREAVCIDTRKIFDACTDKDCIKDLQVIFPDNAQHLLDCASSIKVRCAEVMDVHFEVEPLAFNKGFYSVDLTFFFRITVTICSAPSATPTLIEGVAMFCKKVVLFGSEAGVKIFSNDCNETVNCPNIPIVTVQAIDPMILASRICEEQTPVPPRPSVTPSLPCEIAAKFEGNFDCVTPFRTLYITIGLFSIVQLMRQVQIMVPAYDYCIPSKECTSNPSVSEDPCALFSKVSFPTDEFFPPRQCEIE